MPEIFNPSGLLAPLNSYGLPLLLFLFYAPQSLYSSAHGLSLDSSSQWWILVPIVFAGLLTVTFNISGPFRYGKNQYTPEFTKIVKGLPDWAPSAAVILLVLLPWSRIWLLVLIPLAWKYTQEHYREVVQDITDVVDAAQSKATSASRAASEDALSAARYEDRAFDITARSWRDVRAGLNLRVADYYDKEAQAWAAVDQVVKATADAAIQAQNVDDQVDQAQNRNPSFGISSLYTMARNANNLASDARDETRKAQDRVLRFRDAAALVNKSREDELRNARRATDLMDRVTASAAAASSAALSVREHAEEALQFGIKARTQASLGNISSAKTQANFASEAADKAVAKSKAAEQERNKCRAYVKTLASG